jgi:hypothetical protein
MGGKVTKSKEREIIFGKSRRGSIGYVFFAIKK